ncbi:cyclic nucleotide-binding domain-containing protein [Botrimarina hoheduenensis]|uniref:Putative ferredoxin-like protein YdhX n=1 Tax=Botrimarina hoheduenensis TaxID=2528000 RepID=A0A5C5VZA8_9BACT|nr:cyclic nucleotide-binding domain-containing protein [Botrimarina hoheduenensis]TWT43427.1 putative ferredoxin-like protein YdhX precursor [Botrimarina hoheduenensis]
MTTSPTTVAAGVAPQRWQAPLDDAMTDTLVERLMRVAPFNQMDETAFPASIPLRGLLKNDTRIRRRAAGEVLMREGDYGDTAFLLLDGQARVTLESLTAAELGLAETPRRAGLGSAIRRTLATVLGPAKPPEVRDRIDARAADQRSVFVQDVSAVLDSKRTALLSPGEVFGELAVLTRAPRTATVFAEGSVVALEIRWQGLRDLMRFTPAWRAHIDRLYRDNSLRVHLRATPLFTSLDEQALERVASAIEFATFGSFDWRDLPPDPTAVDPLDRVRREAQVVKQDDPIEYLLLVRSGFARVSVAQGEGQRTIAYHGKGSVLGAEALLSADNASARWPVSIHAVGYLDVLRLPTDVFLAEVGTTSDKVPVADSELPARTLDYLVDRRLINGVEAMVIDLDRCTRCDDCVRACAATHDGNPRFIRQGPTHDHFQFAHACMHCVDPVCMIGCPTGAIHRDPATGVVRVNDATCVGCSVCANACPYNNIQMVEVRAPEGAIVFDQVTGQPLLRAAKCDLCSDQPTGPACQHACPHDALVRIDLSSPHSLASLVSR